MLSCVVVLDLDSPPSRMVLDSGSPPSVVVLDLAIGRWSGCGARFKSFVSCAGLTYEANTRSVLRAGRWEAGGMLEAGVPELPWVSEARRCFGTRTTPWTSYWGDVESHPATTLCTSRWSKTGGG